jgi:hypothetical protein
LVCATKLVSAVRASAKAALSRLAAAVVRTVPSRCASLALARDVGVPRKRRDGHVGLTQLGVVRETAGPGNIPEFISGRHVLQVELPDNHHGVEAR